MALLDALYQETWWGKGEDAVLITDLETRHLLNIISWLWRNRESLKLAAEAQMAFGYKPTAEAAGDAFEAAFNELLETSSADWLRGLPLSRALAEEMTRRADEGKE